MNASATGIEGQLYIALQPRSDGWRATITSTRPVLAARVFEHKPVAEALRTIPLLFNVCGQAQAVAAIRAIETAQSRPASTDIDGGRSILVALETLREHILRVGLDWPRFVGTEPALPSFTSLLKLCNELQHAVDPNRRLTTSFGLADGEIEAKRFDVGLTQLRMTLADQWFGCALQDWLAMDSTQLLAWIGGADTPVTPLLKLVTERGWETLGAVPIACLPPMPAEALVVRLDGPEAGAFIRQPEWSGEPYETGAFARRADHPLIAAVTDLHGRGLLARLTGRLVEIAELALDPRGALATDLPRQRGLSQLEAARGRLCHRVELAGDRLERLRILAPTEWNFHRHGLAAGALATLRDENPETTRFQAKLLIHAIDPCVGYELVLHQGNNDGLGWEE